MAEKNWMWHKIAKYYQLFFCLAKTDIQLEGTYSKQFFSIYIQYYWEFINSISSESETSDGSDSEEDHSDDDDTDNNLNKRVYDCVLHNHPSQPQFIYIADDSSRGTRLHLFCWTLVKFSTKNDSSQGKSEFTVYEQY